MLKLKEKKGFTLVELMIVVVIMGILVAVAVPVYGAITKNAEKKTCKSNQEIIVKAVQQFTLLDLDVGAAGIFKNPGVTEVNIASQEDAENTFVERYLNCFDGGKFPKCPKNGYYNIKVDSTGKSVLVECKNTASPDDAHGSWK